MDYVKIVLITKEPKVMVGNVELMVPVITASTLLLRVSATILVLIDRNGVIQGY